MTDLFKDKAQDWDARQVPARISEGVGAAMLASVPLRPEMRVMDFGAGTGLICARVSAHVRTVYAVDISPAMLAQLAAKPELRGKVEVFCQDITKTPLGKPVDLIVSAMAMHHVEDGSFHPADVEGVFHHGFARENLGQRLASVGFTEIAFTTATQVFKNERSYDIFHVNATKQR